VVVFPTQGAVSLKALLQARDAFSFGSAVGAQHLTLLAAVREGAKCVAIYTGTPGENSALLKLIRCFAWKCFKK